MIKLTYNKKWSRSGGTANS